MNARRYLPALLLIPLLLANVAASPAITIVNRLFVAPGGLSSGTCDSWANACNLQFALFYASGDVGDDELWVKQGTYTPGTLRTDTFALQDGVSILGGFAGTETSTSQRNSVKHVTILSGDIGAVGDISDNSYHVVTAAGTDGTAVLDGFTITGGNASGAFPNDRGGGMYNSGGGPALATVTFSSNSATLHGGGMYNYNSSPTLASVTLTGNKAGVTGGGMYNYNSSAALMKVTFYGNSATSGGGGMYNYISNPMLVNVTFYGNSATSGGGGMNNNESSPKLTNVTFSGNKAGYGGGMENSSSSQPAITDSILYGDTGGEIYNDVSTPTVTYSDLQGGYAGTGNVNGNPVLGPLENNGGYAKTMALGAGSVAIDRGNNSTCAGKDQRGVTRPQGGRCDMGAYEVKALKFVSAGTYDGQVLEFSENSSSGGSKDSASTTLRVGDDPLNKQYRGFLSFNTALLPDAATVVLAKVGVKKAGVTGSPFSGHGKLLVDVGKPYFGTGLALVLTDFQADATASQAGTIGSTLSSGRYLGSLNSAGNAVMNKTGMTQFRLRFATDDDNDHLADYLSLYSGNAITSYRPLLIVYYNP